MKRQQLGWILAAIGLAVARVGAETYTTNIVNGVTTNAVSFYVGNTGPYNLLIVTNAGVVSDTLGYIGNNVGANFNTAMVTGVGSVWSNTSSLVVGNSSAANNNTLIIAGGAYVSDYAGSLGSTSNSVLVTDAGSVWSNRNNLTVGGMGTGNQLTITNGGAVFCTNALIGSASAAQGNIVLVTGSGSVLRTRNELYVGEYSASSLLTITDGAVVSARYGYLGNWSSSSNNTAVVTGSGSVWSNSMGLYVGNNGGGNRLIITNGGTVRASSTTLGSGSGGNNTVLVTGPGSVLTNLTGISVGGSSPGNQLTISDGAIVYTPYSYIGDSSAASSNNTVLVTGAGSVWSNSQVVVGNSGAGNQMIVTNGAKVYAVYSGYMGYNTSSSNNTVLVTDAGSVWRNLTGLLLGCYVDGFGSLINGGASNRLTVASDGLVLVGGVATNALPALAGAGIVVVGDTNSTKPKLQLGNRSRVTADYGYIGNGPGESGAALIFSNSVWSNSNYLYVGNYGAGSQLTISNGGKVYNTAGYVGFDSSSSSNNTVVVTGAGSTWQNYTGLGLGGHLSGGAYVDGGANNRLTVTNNGWVLVGGVATNALPALANAGGVAVGDSSGTQPTLVLGRGTVLTSGYGYLGNGSGETGAVLVTGSGTIWRNLKDLYVGNNGGGNSLTITNGGLVAVSSNAIIGANSSGNQLTVFGSSSLIVTNAGGTGRLEVRTGGLNVYSGIINVNQLLATNGDSSVITFNGGTLQTGGTTISNNTALVVGDGTQTATLILAGGTHNIANDLNIAGNATLQGTGTLTTPNLTLAGTATLAPGRSPGQLTLNGNLLLASNSTFSVEMAGYTLGTEYDQLVINGATTNNNATLLLTLLSGFIPTNGAQFVIMDNTSDMVGIFNGAPEGSINSFGSGQSFQITYIGGADNHDVVLSVIPEPSSMVLAGLLGLLVVGWRRLRRWAS